MANWSTTVAEITCNENENEQVKIDKINLIKKKIEELTEDRYINAYKLQKDDSIDSRAKYSGAEIIDIVSEDVSVTYILQGRWCSPSQMFIDFCEELELNLLYIDREGGCNFTHVVEMTDGIVEVNEEDDYISKLAIKYCKDEVFEETINWIMEQEVYEEEDGIRKFFEDEDNSNYKLAFEDCLEEFINYCEEQNN